jgi:hypothetical protein
MTVQYRKISVTVGSPPKEEIWELCNENHSYCPTHGKCPDILDSKNSVRDANGKVVYEVVRAFIAEPMFFCKKCGRVKMINVWNNCSGLTEARLVEQPKEQKTA